MPSFTYRAVRADGQEETGSLDARDRNEAFRRLTLQGLQPFSLEAGRAIAAKAAAARENRKPVDSAKADEGKARPEGGVRLNTNELILFTDELSDLLNAGLQLEPALKLMESRGEKSKVQQVAGVIRERVRDGDSMARALQTASPSFGPLYCSLASAGEQAGALDTILKRQAAYLTTLNELRGKVMTAMIYPAFLILSGVAVTLLFVTLLIPKLMDLIAATGAETPFVARLMVGMSGFLQQFWWLILLLVAGAVVAFRMVTRRPDVRPVWDREKLRIPLTGPLISARFHVQFLETLSNLIANGMPLLNSLQLARGTIQNQFLREKVDRIVEEVGDGASLARAMDRSTIFPPKLTDLVRVGEQTGKLQESLAKAAARFEKELGVKIERVSAVIQPAIIVIMAGLVGVMAWMMISTIYQTISLLQTAR